MEVLGRKYRVMVFLVRSHVPYKALCFIFIISPYWGKVCKTMLCHIILTAHMAYYFHNIDTRHSTIGHLLFTIKSKALADNPLRKIGDDEESLIPIGKLGINRPKAMLCLATQ